MITERDKHLCGVLAHARWLTTPQVTRLGYPGRHKRDILRRLQQLSMRRGDVPALLERHVWVMRDGLKHVWGLTPAGYAEAGVLLDEELTPPPIDFEPETMAHHVALTDLYVGLLAAPVEAALAKVPAGLPRLQRQKALAGLYARALHRGWRWTVVGDGVHLPWRVYEDGRHKEKVLRPDAVLELVQPRRRVFVEAETGTHTVVPRHADNKPNSTMAKLDRYEAYLSGMGDAESRKSWYQVRYPDGFAPELVFLVHSETRAKTVSTAIDAWARKQPGQRLEARALTLPAMLASLGAVVPPTASVVEGRESGRARRLVLSEAEARTVVTFSMSFRNDFKRREALAAGADLVPAQKPESYEELKALARRLYELLPAGPAK